MPTITTTDGTEIFCKDWGVKDAPVVMFHHGWPLSSDDWDAQMMFFVGKGYRVIAHDRRGHGRSTQSGSGHDMDTYVADVIALTDALDLKDAIHGRSLDRRRRGRQLRRPHQAWPDRQSGVSEHGRADHGQD